MSIIGAYSLPRPGLREYTVSIVRIVGGAGEGIVFSSGSGCVRDRGSIVLIVV